MNMGQRSGTSARTQAPVKAAEAVTRRDAERIAREKNVRRHDAGRSARPRRSGGRPHRDRRTHRASVGARTRVPRGCGYLIGRSHLGGRYASDGSAGGQRALSKWQATRHVSALRSPTPRRAQPRILIGEFDALAPATRVEWPCSGARPLRFVHHSEQSAGLRQVSRYRCFFCRASVLKSRQRLHYIAPGGTPGKRYGK